MLTEIKKDAKERMHKSTDVLKHTLGRIRTGRANPGLLEGVSIDYYGSDTPINQLANIVVEDSRTLTITPWDVKAMPDIERAILKSDLGLNPAVAGNVMRIPMPALTEETRKGYIRQAKQEVEAGRVSIRNIRRDAIAHIKDLIKSKEISEDEERKGSEDIQKMTDSFIQQIEELLVQKEKDLLEI